MPMVFLKSGRLFLFFKDIIIGFWVCTNLATPRAIAFEPPAGAGRTTLLPRSATRFFRRRTRLSEEDELVEFEFEFESESESESEVDPEVDSEFEDVSSEEVSELVSD